MIASERLSDDVLESAKKIRSEIQTKKDAINEVLNRAEQKMK